MEDELMLDPWDVRELAGGELHTNPETVDYGAPWSELIERAEDMNELLEFAALAGRLGICTTGVFAAIEATMLGRVAASKAAQAAGQDRLALLWLSAYKLRDFAAGAEHMVAELEDHAAELLREWANDETQDLAARRKCLAYAEDAEARAARARARKELVVHEDFASYPRDFPHPPIDGEPIPIIC